MPLLISVIMPCYNAAPFLEEAVGSVMGQTYPNVELLIVDDGSTDSSLEIAERLQQTHPTRIRLFRQRNRGPFGPFNQAGEQRPCLAHQPRIGRVVAEQRRALAEDEDAGARVRR